MKGFSLIIPAVVIVTCCSCNETETTSSKSGEPPETFHPMQGTGTIEGYVGYFSAAIPPPNSRAGYGYPSGYASSNARWLTDSPKVPYWMIFFRGKESLLRNAIYIRASGDWETKLTGKEETYIEMKVDSLVVIEQKGTEIK